MSFSNRILYGVLPFDQDVVNNYYRTTAELRNEDGSHIDDKLRFVKTKFQYYKYSPYPREFDEVKNKYGPKRDKRNFVELTYDKDIEITNEGIKSVNSESIDYNLSISDRMKDEYESQKDKIYEKKQYLINKLNEEIRAKAEKNKKGKKELKEYTDKDIEFTYSEFAHHPRDKESMQRDEDRPKKSKLNLKTAFNYYYDKKLIDGDNHKTIMNNLFPKNRTRDVKMDFKTYKSSLTHVLKFETENGEEIKTVLGSDLTDLSEPHIEIYFREVFGNINDYEHPATYKTVNEINEIYGEPRKVTITTIDEMQEYMKPNSYYRFGFKIEKLTASSDVNIITKERIVKDETTCYFIDVINFKQKLNGNKNTIDNVFGDFEEATEEMNNIKLTDKAKSPNDKKNNTKTNDSSKDSSSEESSSEEDSSDDSSDESSDDDSKNKKKPSKK